MKPFQYITLPITVILSIWNLIRLITGKKPRNMYLLGAIIWLTATTAIILPDSTMQFAHILGIGRGADLVLYILVITFLVFMFYIYQRLQRMETQITEIVRNIALHNVLKSKEPTDAQKQEKTDIES